MGIVVYLQVHGWPALDCWSVRRRQRSKAVSVADLLSARYCWPSWDLSSVGRVDCCQGKDPSAVLVVQLALNTHKKKKNQMKIKQGPKCWKNKINYKSIHSQSTETNLFRLHFLFHRPST